MNVERSGPWRSLRYNSRICVGGLKRTTRNFSHNIRYLDRDSKRTSPEYNSEVLLNEPVLHYCTSFSVYKATGKTLLDFNLFTLTFIIQANHVKPEAILRVVAGVGQVLRSKQVRLHIGTVGRTVNR
jgi:hypothetical protein